MLGSNNKAEVRFKAHEERRENYKDGIRHQYRDNSPHTGSLTAQCPRVSPRQRWFVFANRIWFEDRWYLLEAVVAV
jgi:hypothetical protein